MSTVIWWSGFGLYCALILATWCAGAFGIGASIGDVHEKAIATSRRNWYGSDEYAGFHFAKALLGLCLLTTVAGLVWPVAIPLYLAYSQGPLRGRRARRAAGADEVGTAFGRVAVVTATEVCEPLLIVSHCVVSRYYRTNP